MNALHIKAAVRERDGYRCTVCGLTNRQHLRRFGRVLDVHRIIPGSRYSLKGCRTVCRPCHGSQPRRPKGVAPEIVTDFHKDPRETFCLSWPLLRALEAHIGRIRPRPSKSEVLRLALEEYLRRVGELPSPPDQS